MPKKVLTPAAQRYIRQHYLKISGADLARRFKVSQTPVRCFMKKNGLKVPKKIQNKFRSEARGIITTSTPKLDKLILKHYLDTPSKRLATMIGRSDTFVRCRMRQLGLKIPRKIIEQRKIDSRIKPGSVPANKGKKMSRAQYKKCKASMFQKGHLPKNTKHDGAITIRHVHPERNGRKYQFIRIGLGKWQLLHQHIWEKKYGKVPAGHCLWFKDGNSLNCTLENLELITRNENARRNQDKFFSYPQEIQQASRLLKKLNKRIANVD